MTCEARVVVVVKNVTVLPKKIFSSAGDRLDQKDVFVCRIVGLCRSI